MTSSRGEGTDAVGAGATGAPAVEPARRPRAGSGAGSLLNTIIGEFVHPCGGSVWTQTLLDAVALFGVEAKAARMALSRIEDEGLLRRDRHGREVRWTLTAAGQRQAEHGRARIHGFTSGASDWDGTWLVVLLSVPEEQRVLRHSLRRRLGWAGFGSLGQGAWITPHVDREAEVARLLGEVGLGGTATSFRGSFGALGDLGGTVATAWPIAELGDRYRAFLDEFTPLRPEGGRAAFAALTRLVHEWRRFPFDDPGLPARLLPPDWPGRPAATLFRERHERWAADAVGHYRALERRRDGAGGA